jgi:lipid-A-disaccharide synthase-like uncharacterized protein
MLTDHLLFTIPFFKHPIEITLLVLFGMIGNLLFTIRMLIQWISSEKNKQSVVPVSFWWLSVVATLVFLIYAYIKQDLPFLLGYLIPLVAYIRNLVIYYRPDRPARSMGPIMLLAFVGMGLMLWTLWQKQAATRVEITGRLEQAGSPLTGTRPYKVEFFNAAQGGERIGWPFPGATKLTADGGFKIVAKPSTKALGEGPVYYQLSLDASRNADQRLDSEDALRLRMPLAEVEEVLDGEEDAPSTGTQTAGETAPLVAEGAKVAGLTSTARRVGLDIWFYFGLLGNLVFTSRFIVAWVESEKRRESVLSMKFWVIGLVGSLMLLVYSLVRRDPVFILGFVFNGIPYVRNIMLIRKRERAAAQQAAQA